MPKTAGLISIKPELLRWAMRRGDLWMARYFLLEKILMNSGLNYQHVRQMPKGDVYGIIHRDDDDCTERTLVANKQTLITFEHGDRAINIELYNGGVEFTLRGGDSIWGSDHRPFRRIMLDRHELEELRLFFARAP